MVLPTSGTISTNQIRAEFGASGSTQFPEDFYRGGPYVPNTIANNSVPTSGPMTLPNNFWGARQSTGGPGGNGGGIPP